MFNELNSKRYAVIEHLFDICILDHIPYIPGPIHITIFIGRFIIMKIYIFLKLKLA